LDSINAVILHCYFKPQLLLYCALLSRYYLVDTLSLFVADVGFIRLSKQTSNQTIQKKKHQNESQRLLLLPKDSLPNNQLLLNLYNC